MRLPSNQGYGTVIFSIVVAMGLRILPWSRDWIVFNPDWTLLTVIYWCLIRPKRFNIGSAWVVGLLADALTGQVLGHHALVYSVIAYLVVRFHVRMSLFRLPQQIMVVLCLLFLSQLVSFWSQNIQATGYASWTFWIPPCTGAMLWPVVYILLGGMHHKKKID